MNDRLLFAMAVLCAALNLVLLLVTLKETGEMYGYFSAVLAWTLVAINKA